MAELRNWGHCGIARATVVDENSHLGGTGILGPSICSVYGVAIQTMWALGS
jgi:hypothetical protein